MNFLEYLVPPLAFSRHQASIPARIPTSVVWLGGLLLLSYSLYSAVNNAAGALLSLAAGMFLIGTSAVWTYLALSRIKQEQSQNAANDHPYCRISPSAPDKDPLAEAERSAKILH